MLWGSADGHKATRALVSYASEFSLEGKAQVSGESHLSGLISVSHFSPPVADTKKLLHMQADNSKGKKRKFTTLLFLTPTENRQLPKRQQVLYILSMKLDWIKGWLFLFMQQFWTYHFMSVSVCNQIKWINTPLMGGQWGGGVICAAGRQSVTKGLQPPVSLLWSQPDGKKTFSSPPRIVQDRNRWRGKKRGGVREKETKERELEVAAVKQQSQACASYGWQRSNVNTRLRVPAGSGARWRR